MQLRLYPSPNPGLMEALNSPQAAIYMYNVAVKIKMAYSVNAQKRTGHMASSARASITKRRPPKASARAGKRWSARVTVTADYAVWRETGAGPGMHRLSTGKKPWGGPYDGAYTFEKITGKVNRTWQ